MGRGKNKKGFSWGQGRNGHLRQKRKRQLRMKHWLEDRAGFKKNNARV